MVLSALVLMTGCAVKPPKAGVVVLNKDPVYITENSSNALLSLHASKASGVRDLTIEEYSKYKKDREHLESNVGSREGLNRTAYEAGGIGIGLAAGLSLGAVLSYGALTALVSDDSPDNYVFAWDFDGRLKVYSASGNVDQSLVHAAIISAVEKSIDVYSSVFPNGQDLVVEESKDGFEKHKISLFNKRTAYDKSHKKIKHEINTIYLKVFYSSLGKREVRVSAQSHCSGLSQNCELTVFFGEVGKAHTLTTSVVRFIAYNLPADYFIYLPPDKSLYRLPMIIRGGTGEIEYLVEK